MHMKKLQALVLAAAIAACPVALSSCTGLRSSPSPNQTGTTQGQNLGYRGQNMGATTTMPGLTGMGTGIGGTGAGGTGMGGTGIGGTGMGGTGTRMSGTGTAPAPGATMTADATRARRIQSELTRQMPQLKDLNVVVAGNTALIGYKSTGKATAGTTATKNSITTRVKKIDPSITTIEVTTKADLVAAIKKMSDDITKNRVKGTITTEFNKLIARVRSAV